MNPTTFTMPMRQGYFGRCFPKICSDSLVRKFMVVPKNRVTLPIGVNMSGTNKLPLLAIGKSKNLRAFKNVRKLPVDYEANKKA